MSLLGLYLALACWWEDKTYRLERRFAEPRPRWVYLLSEFDSYRLFEALNNRQNSLDRDRYARLRAKHTDRTGGSQ